MLHLACSASAATALHVVGRDADILIKGLGVGSGASIPNKQSIRLSHLRPEAQPETSTDRYLLL
jgi:hypothetical protein